MKLEIIPSLKQLEVEKQSWLESVSQVLRGRTVEQTSGGGEAPEVSGMKHIQFRNSSKGLMIILYNYSDQFLINSTEI